MTAPRGPRAAEGPQQGSEPGGGFMADGIVLSAVLATIFAAAIVWRVVMAGPVTSASLEPGLLSGADPDRGAELFISYGCGTCHTVPDLGGARGTVGPNLREFARRSFIAGQVANVPDNLVQWIVVPESIAPGTAMPTIGVSEEDARQIAAFLYTLD